MGFLTATCTVGDPATSESNCRQEFGVIKRLIVANSQYTFASETDAETLSNWLSLITGATTPKQYPFPESVLQTNEGGEPVEEDVSRDETNTLAVDDYTMTFRLSAEAICRPDLNFRDGMS